MPISIPRLLLALSAVPAVMGHTWIEQLRNINDKGDFVGEYGYARGMVSKTDAGFNGDSMNWELPRSDNITGGPYISASTKLCHPSQRKQVQSADNYPRLQAVPGGFMAMRYMENGHVSLPNNQLGKPENGGTVFVYGTTEPKEDEKLVDVLRWTKDGAGGDKRGVLLALNDFDDGRCYEKNSSPLSLERQKSDPNFAMGQVSDGPGNFPLFCETNAALPKDAQTGKPYTLYWVWQWNTVAGVDPGLPTGKDEYYTTCIDVDVVDTFAKDVEKEFALGPQQDAMSVAVQAFASRTAIITDPIAHEMGPVFNSTPTATGGAPGPSQSTLITSKVANTMTELPGTPTSAPGNDNVVTVTETQVVTVTAEVTQHITARAASAAAATHVAHVANHKANHKAKFRGRFIRD